MASLTTLLGVNGGEKPKVFFNGTLTSDQLTGNDTYTVFTNDAQTTAVVESLSADPDAQPTLKDGTVVKADVLNDGTKVGETVNSSGSAIVAPSTSLTFRLQTPVIPGTAEYYADGLVNFVVSSPTEVKMEGPAPYVKEAGGNYQPLSEADIITSNFDAGYTSKTTNSVTKTVPSMTNPRWYIEVGDNAYYYYYDGNSTTRLYHATITSGTVGAWSTVDANSYSYKALDLDQKKVRWVDDQAIYEHDLETNTTTLLDSNGSTGGNPSSYTSAGSVNGVLFWIEDSSARTVLFYYDTNTSTAGSISLSPQVSSSTGAHLGASYNADEDRYYFTIGYSSLTDLYSVPGDLSSATHLGDGDTPWPNGWGAMYYVQGNGKGEMFIENNSSQMEIVRFDNDTVSSVEIVANINGATSPASSGGWFRAPLGIKQTASLAADDYDVSLKCLVSGTEYKETT